MLQKAVLPLSGLSMVADLSENMAANLLCASLASAVTCFATIDGMLQVFPRQAKAICLDLAKFVSNSILETLTLNAIHSLWCISCGEKIHSASFAFS